MKKGEDFHTTENTVCGIKLHAGQRLLAAGKERFKAAIAGIQSGKTTMGAIWLCLQIYANWKLGRRGNYLIAAPTYKILEQSTIPKFREIIPADWYEYKENKKCFDLKWGDKVFCRSTDLPDSLEGMTLLAAWLDEAGQMTFPTWVNIQGRLSTNKGPCLMTTTPYAMGWFYREIFKKAGFINGKICSGGDADIGVYRWASNENPSFPQEEFDRARNSFTEAIFKRRYLGEFIQLEGLVYPVFNEDTVIRPFQLPPHWKVFGGIDFGFSNPSAAVCVAEDPVSGVNYAFKEFYRTESQLDQIARFLQDNNLKPVYGDPQSAQLISELNKAYGVGVVPADNDINVGIQRVTALLKTNKLKIFDCCTNLIDEFETYHYKQPDEEGEVQEKPVAKHNHAVDALRYAFSKQGTNKFYGRDADPFNMRRTRRILRPVTRNDIQTDEWTSY